MEIVAFAEYVRNAVARQVGYVTHLNRNIKRLWEETEKLNAMRYDIKTQVNAAGSDRMILPRVREWLDEADRILDEVSMMMLEVEQGRRLCFCCVNPKPRLKLGRRVAKRIYQVTELRGSELAMSPLHPQTRLRDKIPVPEELKQQSTSKETLEEIFNCLYDKEVSIISVWGVGGIGKTTLVREVHNRLSAAQDSYHVHVIWVTVSRRLDLDDIQNSIGSSLGFGFRYYDDMEGKRDQLYRRLSNGMYVLILDDVWHKFSLDEVGIPRPNSENNHCKVVITTRLKSLGSAMGADRQIEVKTISNDDAWNLFCSKTGNVVLRSEIQPLSKQIVIECGGLPLAITRVGGALRNQEEKKLWEDALKQLRAPGITKVLGIERRVFLPLKLSYDYLEDPKIQLLFLYCLLYPKHYEIDIEKDVLRYWVFEDELMDNFSSLDEAFKEGHGIIEGLKVAGLFREVPKCNQCGQYVRTRSLLLDLASSIPSRSLSGFEASKFLQRDGKQVAQRPNAEIWEGMRRISLMHSKIKKLGMRPNCPDLASLFLRSNDELLTIGDDFFQFMPKLQILDLRNTAIMSLPLSFSRLVSLRVLSVSCCNNLQEMPPLGDLKELRLLDLSCSGIALLPGGIASLAKLKSLDLSHMKALTTIPCNVISRLTCLENLRLEGIPRARMNVDIWREVATLQRLTCLRVELPSLDSFTADDMNHPMWSRLEKFSVQFGVADSGCQAFIERVVCIFCCQDFPVQINFKRLIGNAEALYMSECQGLESLSQIIGDSKSLKYVQLREVQGLKCALDSGEAEKNALSSLEELHLTDLPSLQKVFDGGLSTGFEKLRKICVYGCPKLTCIFSSNMAQHLHQLKILSVNDCEELEEIVEGGSLTDMALQGLSRLYLIKLPTLRTICGQQLVLTSLQYIEVYDCPELQKFPYLGSHIQNIRGQISPSSEWWEGKEWDDEHSKSLYYSIYQ